MDMSNIKEIFDNNVQKNVKKITDADGNIIWYKAPDGYTKLKYIHGDGEQYINTGYTTNANTELIFKYKSNLIVYPGTSRTRCILGGRLTFDNGISIWERDGNYHYGNRSTTYPAIYSAIQNTNIHRIRIAKGGDVYVDGIKVLTYIAGSNFPTGCYLYLFTCLSASGVYTRVNGTDKRTMIGQFYYCIIKDNDVVVRHLVPVLRNSDNKPGMYDLINEVFYTNQGTGEFTYA